MIKDILSKFVNEQVEELSTLVKSVEKEPAKTVDLASNSSVLRYLNEKLLEYMNELCNFSRTAKLWIQYLRYVEILKLFIRAEITGNWNLHLEAVNRMINIFAATGHIHYAKSARLYLQNMLELRTKYPRFMQTFLNMVTTQFVAVIDIGPACAHI